MLSKEVFKICSKHFDYKCETCPLLKVCDCDVADAPGSTEKEKTDLWEQRMNNAATDLISAF